MFNLLWSSLLLVPLVVGPALALPMASHDYELAGTLADDKGGPALTRLAGGTIGTAAAPGFAFGMNDGLQLAGAVSQNQAYSLELLFEFDAVDRYLKIIDFQNRGSDSGLYDGRQKLDLYPRAKALTAQFTPGALADLVFTRSAAGMLTAYVNGALSFSYDDANTDVTASGSNPLIFFADDRMTNFQEASSGFLRRLRVFDSVLTAADAADLASGVLPPGAVVTVPIPEPGSAMALGAALLLLGLVRTGRRWI